MPEFGRLAPRERHGVGSETPDADGALFEAAFEHAGIGMALVGLDGRFTKVNDALCRIVGRSREELLSRDFQSITHPDDLDADLRLVRRLLEGEQPKYDHEKRYLRADGTAVWVLLTASLLRDSAGAPARFIAQIQDISQRKLAESEIEALFQASPDLLAVAGTAGRLELVNPAWEHQLGWSAEELTTRPFLDFVHPEDREGTIAEAEAVYRGAPSPTFCNRYRTKAGDYRTLEWRTRPMAAGRLYCVVRDVTDRVEQERKLSWLAALVASAQDSVVGVDNQGRIVSWNAGAELMTGFSAREMVGRTPDVLLPPGAPSTVSEALRQAAPSETQFSFEAQRQRKDGVIIEVQMHVSRVLDRHGNSLGWAVVTRDVTEAKRMREALTRQVELYTAIARSLPSGSVAMFDRDLRYVAAEGPELFALLQVAPDAIVGRAVADVTSPTNREALLQACRDALQGKPSELEASLKGRQLLLRIAPVFEGPAIVGGVVLSLDVSDRVRQEHELRRMRGLLEATLANIGDGVVLLDEQRRALLHNDAYCQLLALPVDMNGRGPEFFREHLQSLGADAAAVARALAEPGQLSEPRVDVMFLRRSGRWLRRTMTSVDGHAEGYYLVVWRDITREHEQQLRSEQEALTDALTGIGNRRAAQLALDHVAASREPAFVALFDVDHFKLVNDRFGHAAGDDVLRRIASVLAGECRGVDTVARWGGEEFMAIVQSDGGGALAFCERVRRLVAETRFPEVGGVTLSAGLAARDGMSIDDVVQCADRALYAAKSGGRNRVVLCTSSAEVASTTP